MKFAPFTKSYQLKTKLKVAECAEHLGQFCDNDNASKSKPLSGWVEGQSFELTPSQSGILSVQSKGSISADADGSVINVRTELSQSSKRLLFLCACLILGAAASVLHSLIFGSDDVGTIWSFMATVFIPACIWLAALFVIKHSLEPKHKPFINLLCTSLNAHTIDSPSQPASTTFEFKNTKTSRNANGTVKTLAATLVLPFLLGAFVSNTASHKFQDLAFSQWQQGNYSITEWMYKPAAELSSYIFLADPAKQARCMAMFATILKDQSRFAEAESLYRKAIFFEEKSDKVTTATKASTYEDLARVCEAQDKLIQAEEMYNKTLNLLKRDETQSSRIPSPLSKLALLHAKQGKFEQAQEEQKEAISLYEDLLKENPGDSALRKNIAQAKSDFQKINVTTGADQPVTAETE
jgi:hypothetical protein